MALATSQLGATDNAYYVADRPTMLACPIFEAGTRWNADGDIGTADDSDSDYPVPAAYDGAMHTYTRGAQQQQVWYFIAELPTGFRTIDAVFVHIQDVDSDANVTMTAAVSDDGSDWTGPPPGGDVISNISETLGDGQLYRFFFPELERAGDSGDDQRQWTGAKYFRLGFDAGGGQVCRPQLNELIIGQQRQMPTNPLYPLGEDDDDARNEVFVSRSGVRTIYQNFGGAKSLAARWVFGTATDAAKIKSAATGLRADMSYGARPFVWCPAPYTAPNTAYLMALRSPNDFRMPRTSSVQWEWALDAVEQGGALVVDE
jgi:hypothetical protein